MSNSSMLPPALPANGGEHPHGADQNSSSSEKLSSQQNVPSSSSSGAPPSSALEPPTAPTLNYEVPPWSSTPHAVYFFEILKNGTVVGKFLCPRSKEYLVVGRLPTCDIEMEHPSISRMHAVIQFKNDDSVHLFDLGSNHGTYINKTAVPGRTYCHLRPGDIVKFGASTRLYVFSRHGPPPKTSSSSTAAPAALKEEVTWGFGDDAADEDEAEIAAGMNIGLPVNQRKRRRNNNHEEFEDPEDIVKSMARFSGGTATIVEDTNDDTRLIAQDAPYLSDPKKAMKGWLDARGIPMFDLDFENLGAKDGFEAVLDISTPSGRLKSKARGWSKREAEKACYLQACAKLDAAGLFYVSASEARDKERKRWKELVGDDEDDERDSYLDRTGKYDKGSTSDGPKGAAGAKKKTENLASLQAKRQTLVKEVEAMKARITSQESSADKLTHGPGEDDLEGYMAQLAKQEKQKGIEKLQLELLKLEDEIIRTDKLIKVVTPTPIFFSGMAKNNQSSSGAPQQVPKNSEEPPQSTGKPKHTAMAQTENPKTTPSSVNTPKQPTPEITKSKTPIGPPKAVPQTKPKEPRQFGVSMPPPSKEQNTEELDPDEGGLIVRKKHKGNKAKVGDVDWKADELEDWVPSSEKKAWTDAEAESLKAKYGY